jgi:FAD:protein FMN transferase
MDTFADVRRAQPLLGTFVEIRSGGAARSDTERAVDAAFNAIAQAHRLMSFHDPDSDVSRLNRDAFAKPVLVHPWTYQVLEMALEFHRHSAGVFDISVAAALQKFGLLPRHADQIELDAAQRNGSDAIELLPGYLVRFRSNGVRIDLGGIAKGFAVDRAIDVLREHNQLHGLVNAGGDLAVFGPNSENIHIRDPRDPSRSLFQVAISNMTLASSARSFNAFDGIEAAAASVIDPATDEPAKEVAGATVRASLCVVADALTKIVMIAGERAAAALIQYQASALLVMESGDVSITPEWHDAVSAAA